MTGPDESPPLGGPLAQLAQGLQAFNVVAESVVGYRNTLKSSGIADDVADAMAQEYHTTLLGIMKDQLMKQSSQTSQVPRRYR